MSSKTPRGGCNAPRLGERLKGIDFARVFTSPLQRAKRTCELAGYGSRAKVDCDLVEWNYGYYEGLRAADILLKHLDWELFRDGLPAGETFEEIGSRADRVVGRVRGIDGAVLLFLAVTSSESRPRAGSDSSPKMPVTSY